MTIGNYYADEHSHFVPEPSGYYGTVAGRDGDIYQGNLHKLDPYARPQIAINTNKHYTGSNSTVSSSWSSFVCAVVRPCVAEFTAVFIALFIFNHLDSELTERAVQPLQRMLILSAADAVSTAIFVSAFRTVHLNPVITMAHLFSFTTSWYICVILISIQLSAGTLATAANASLRQISPSAITITHDLNTEWTRAACRLMLSQLLGALLYVSAQLLCSSSKRIRNMRIGYLTQSPLCLFLSVLLASFLSLLQSTLSWNPIQAACLALYRLFATRTHDALSGQYVYWLGPITGSLLACALFRFLFTKSDRQTFNLGCRQSTFDDS